MIHSETVKNMMKFDTRNKKPKLYHLLVISVTTVILLTVFMLCHGDHQSMHMMIVLDLYFAVSLVLLVSAFFKQLQYNPYSYNTIFYMGFAVFVVFLLLGHILLTVQLFGYSEELSMAEIFSLMSDSAKTYMLLTFPFILVFSAGLCVSNISLIRHEGKRLVNILGIILSFLLVGGVLLLYLYDSSVSGKESYILLHNLIVNIFSAAYLYFECMLIGVIVADAIAARHDPEPDKDFVIILGCGLKKDGTPMPLLRGRIDRALAFYHKQKETTGKELIFVTSGGQGADEVISESASMKRYLVEHGIPENRIIEEDRSTDTFENMKFSKEKILAVNPQGKIAFSTTNYHVFRSGLFARRVKMRAVGMGAETKWYFWSNAAVREFIGLLTKHRLKQALIFGGMILLYFLLNLLVH